MPTKLTPPTPEELPDLVDRAANLEKRIKQDQKELKKLKALLRLAAEDREPERLKDEHREGRQVMLTGRRVRLPVRTTADALIASFQDNGKTHRELLRILLGATDGKGQEPTDSGDAKQLLALLFAPPTRWERKTRDGQAFRQQLAELLPKHVAAKVVTACRALDGQGIPKTTTVVALDEAEDLPRDNERKGEL